MKEIGVVEVMGQLFNSRSTPTRSNGSKSCNVILLPLFTRQKRERREMEGGRGVSYSEEEERSTEAESFFMRRKRERGRKRELICSEEESLIFCEEERLI